MSRRQDQDRPHQGARRARRIAGSAAAVLVALFVAAGLLHTGPGLRLMVRVGVACPAAAVTPAMAGVLRGAGLAALRGARPAPSRYALGLTLGGSGEAAARAAAARAGEACTRKHRGFVLLICALDGGAAGAAAPARAPRRETTYAFDEHDRLISVDVITRTTGAREIARFFDERATALEAALGGGAERAGDAGQVARNPARFATAMVRYRFSDYLATLTAVRLDDGVAVREQYQAVL